MKLKDGYFAKDSNGDLLDLVDSFIWSKTRQGYEFWEEVLEKTEGL